MINDHIDHIFNMFSCKICFVLSTGGALLYFGLHTTTFSHSYDLYCAFTEVALAHGSS